MQSIATQHFPQVITEGKKKWLFNPVLKKRLANRPEERVRLRWVEYLLYQSDWKKSRIGFETPVKLRQETNSLRADLILYSKDLTPKVLIECKSEKISLTRKVAQQAARYNVSVKANHIVLTNGVTDYWFNRDNQQVLEQHGIFSEVTDLKKIRSEPGYWSRRGFCSSNSSEIVKNLIKRILPDFFQVINGWESRYLAFEDSLLDLPMDQYYRIATLNDKTRLAMSFIGSAHTPSYLIAVLNTNGQNRGVIVINMDNVLNNEPDTVTVFKEGVQTSIDTDSARTVEFKETLVSDIQNLPNRLLCFFD